MQKFILIYQVICAILAIICAPLFLAELLLGEITYAVVFLLAAILFFGLGCIYWPNKFRQWWEIDQKKDDSGELDEREISSSPIGKFFTILTNVLIL